MPGRLLRVVLVAAFGALGLGGVVLAARPEQWLVERVEFRGQQHATVAELRHLADLPNGTRMWEVDPERVAAAVERHPWVESASVARAWPARVVVTVREHAPVALLHRGSALTLVDGAGVPFLDVAPGDGVELDLPHLRGMGPELDALHPDLSRIAIRDALRLLRALDERGLVSSSAVSEIGFDRTTGFEVVAGPARLSFAPDPLPGELDRLDRLVASGVSLSEPVDVELAPRHVAIVRPRAVGLPPAAPSPAVVASGTPPVGGG